MVSTAPMAFRLMSPSCSAEWVCLRALMLQCQQAARQLANTQTAIRPSRKTRASLTGHAMRKDKHEQEEEEVEEEEEPPVPPRGVKVRVYSLRGVCMCVGVLAFVLYLTAL